MDEKTLEIRKIVGIFLKIPPEKVVEATMIDRKALGNSIFVHRLYAVLEKELGLKILDYSNVNTFGDLLRTTTLGENSLPKLDNYQFQPSLPLQPSAPGVGIDLERIDNFSTPADFREDVFYQQNFSQEEISHCLLQKKPLVSFAGLFCAKEAIVKADNSYKGIVFKQINIKHDDLGKPYCAGFSLSLAYAGEYVVAVAIANGQTPSFSQKEQSGNKLAIFLALIAILLSLASLLLILFKFFF
ncbi:MAG: 4'-phosphopantetheinyl transferase superfamily protein [Candidatus Saganbacteria bacterium]|nr:4'-phosphopantetheinyl transferase superfamily protein [Candidatus Saganbacteria bacterium]